MTERRFKKPYKPRLASRKDYTQKFAVAPLPAELLMLTPILNQGNVPSCTACAAVSIRQSMTGRVYSKDSQWEAEKQFVGGNVEADGIKLKDQLACGVKIGFFPEGQPLPTDKASLYFFLKDMTFDGIRNALAQRKVPFTCGLNWYASFDTPDGIVPHTAQNLFGGHDVKLAGFTTKNGVEYLVIQNSWGEGYGDNGLFYFDRWTTEQYLAQYALGYWSDDPNDEIKKYGLLEALLQNVVALYRALIANSKLAGTYPPALLWDTPANARHSVRVICDEEGLSWNDKNILAACVQVESGFNPLATHPNKDKTGAVWSTDYGIAQINDYWNIGEGKPFPSVDYVLKNPEACVRWMCKMWKQGKQSLWSSYTTGLYKRYL